MIRMIQLLSHPPVAAVAAVTLLASGTTPARAQTVLAERFVSGFDAPVAVAFDPTDPDVAFVVEQAGRIRVVEDGAVRPGDFLDLRGTVVFGGERGLLGLVFAPDYATSGRRFVCFTTRDGSVVARFERSADDPLRADPSSRRDFRWPGGETFVAQPFNNHNGGHLAFGDDGHLYLSFGDGGSANDPDHRAQDPRTLLGKMLRLDVDVPDDDPEGYDVPPDNPFVGRSDVLDEIWAFGLRNPWRWSFDRASRGGTSAMITADVGQNRWEEINYEPAGVGGRNYGWRNREGRHDNLTTRPPFSHPLTEPVLEYDHDTGRSVTGGQVYRGRALGSDIVGRYVFADYVSNRVWSTRFDVDPATGAATAGPLVEHTADLGPAARSVVSFGIDTDGELYVVSYTGTIYRLVAPAGTPPADPSAPDPPIDPDPPAAPPDSAPDTPTRQRGTRPVTGTAVPR